jgi:hypothetical protein
MLDHFLRTGIGRSSLPLGLAQLQPVVFIGT